MRTSDPARMGDFLSLENLIELFNDAPRIGAEKDEPEGGRYIQMSDTLARNIAHSLIWLNGVGDKCQYCGTTDHVRIVCVDCECKM